MAKKGGKQLGRGLTRGGEKARGKSSRLTEPRQWAKGEEKAARESGSLNGITRKVRFWRR